MRRFLHYMAENGQTPTVNETIADRVIGPSVRRAVARELDAREHVASELIGRYSLGEAQLYRSRARVKTVDDTIPDYEFWDRLRRGKAKGYTLGALFARRIENILSSWVFGRGVAVNLAESGPPDDENDPRNYTDGLLTDFLNDHMPDIMDTYREALGLGDQYVVVNADGTLSIPSPDTVEVEYADDDYRRVERITITTKLDKVTIKDEYTAARRTVTRKEGGQEEVQTFPNLIGRIPIVHVAHGRSANETHGHPIHDPLRILYDQYDNIAFKQIDGAELLGNPIPYIAGLLDTAEVLSDNRPAEYDTYLDKDGNEVERDVMNFDANTVLLLGEGAAVGFAGPDVGFTEDTKNVLKTLFLLLLDHTGIPEFIWGNELSSSRASSDTQMTQWVRDVEGRQRVNEGWLVELCEIWLLVTALVDARVVLDELTVAWPPLIEEDETLRLERVKLGKGLGLLTDKTALALLDLVDDPEREAAEARAEADARREEMFPEGDTTMFQQRLQQDDDGEEEGDEA